MKKLSRWFSDIFTPTLFNDMDTAAIGEAFNDPHLRTLWLAECLEEIKRINIEVDKRLLSDAMLGTTDLCARRKAYQDVLESILSIRRQATRPNPRPQVAIDLDRVTA